MNSSIFRLTATSLISAACLAACGGGGGGGGGTSVASQTTSSPSTPTTDAIHASQPCTRRAVRHGQCGPAGEPGCGFDAVNVTVTKIRFNMSATAHRCQPRLDRHHPGPAATGQYGRQLRNGATLNLGTAALAPGHYAQARLVLDANTNNSTINSVVATGATTEMPLMTQIVAPEGVRSFGSGFDIANGQTYRWLPISTAAARSCRTTASFRLRPVMNATCHRQERHHGYRRQSPAGQQRARQRPAKRREVRATMPDPSTENSCWPA